MTEFIITLKAYILLISAVIHGESMTYANEDFFIALCYLDKTPIHECIDYKNQGFVQGMFPMDMSE
jgi:hypothetical protein